MRILTFVFIYLIFTSITYANETDKVAKAVKNLTDAMIAGDGKALNNLTSDKLSYGHSSGVMQDKAEFIEKLTTGESDFININLENQSIRISGDTALVRHDLKANILDNGTPANIHLGILLVWQKQGGKWKLLARQAFKYLSPPK